MLDPFTLEIWRFVRGDIEPCDFERWLYAQAGELDSRLGVQNALDLLSADYGTPSRRISAATIGTSTPSLPEWWTWELSFVGPAERAWSNAA